MEELTRTSMLMEARELYIKYRESREGKILRGMLKKLNQIAELLLDLHDINCCSKQHDKHFKFQCGFSKEPLIATYHWLNYTHLGAEQVEQFVTFVAASEVDSFMAENYETCMASNKLKFTSSWILNYCLENFSNNDYIIDYKKRLLAAQEGSHILQDAGYENISQYEEEKEELMEEEKEECEPPLPLSEDDSKSQTQDTFVMYENPCYIDDVSTQNSILIYDNPCYCDEVDKASINDAYEDEFATVIYDNPCFIDKSYDNPLFVPTIEIHVNEELCLESLYDNALDDGPMLLDDKHYNSIESGFDPTIFEMDRNYVLVDHEKPVLSDRYIVQFVHDATKNYYERGKYGY